MEVSAQLPKSLSVKGVTRRLYMKNYLIVMIFGTYR